MKKKLIPAALLLTAIICSLAGCKSKNTSDNLSSIHTQASSAIAAETMPSSIIQPGSASSEAESPSASSETPSDKPVSSSTAPSYQTAFYQKNNIEIQYPVITIPENSAAEAAVNTLIRENALSLLNMEGINQETDSLGITSKVISIDRKRICITYYGLWTAAGQTDGTSLFYTNTVDLAKQDNIIFSDYMDPYTMAGYVLSDDCQLVDSTGERKAAIIQEIRAKNLDYYTDLFTRADFQSSSAGDSPFPQSFSYEEGGSFYFTIPISHQLGDHALVIFTPETK